MEQICVIFAGGPEQGNPCLPVPDDAFILCADSGLRLAERLHIRPDLVLGDFDSLGSIPEDYPHITVPVEKDDTDTLLAARTALSRGYRDIRIYGAFGGRLDHTLANIQTLEFIHEAGGSGMLIGVHDYAVLQTAGIPRRYPRMDGFTLSAFAWTDRCTDVDITGTHYPLSGGTLTRSFPLGVSNEITGPFAEISIGEGLLLVICSQL